MKIIFLDIDWVLIPLLNKTPENADFSLSYMDRAKSLLSQDACFALAKILSDPSVWIVVSSSWRHHWEWLKELLSSVPTMQNDTIWDRVISKTWHNTWGWRSTEILMWLNEYHRTARFWYHVTHWVAIDDEQFDMKAIRRIGKLIKTESGVWLTSEQTDEIISLLNH